MKTSIVLGAVAITIVAAGGVAWRAGLLPHVPLAGARAQDANANPKPKLFMPPPDSAIPNDKFGEEVKMGEQIFREPAAHATQFVGNQLRCSNCHLQAGGRRGQPPCGLPTCPIPLTAARMAM